MSRLALLLATGFGLGRLPIAPATWASAAVALLLIPDAMRAPAVLAAALAVVLAAGVWASGEAEKTLGHDAKPIVIDEVAGMLLAVIAVPRGDGPPYLFLAAAFLLFRFFDILKPPPIRQAQALPGGWGVVADDVLAGLATNVALRVAHAAGVSW
jgi:phosphatidylglycerophosphatase A